MMHFSVIECLVWFWNSSRVCKMDTIYKTNWMYPAPIHVATSYPFVTYIWWVCYACLWLVTLSPYNTCQSFQIWGEAISAFISFFFVRLIPSLSADSPAVITRFYLLKVKIWFQNRRMKWKRMLKNGDNGRHHSSDDQMINMEDIEPGDE